MYGVKGILVEKGYLPLSTIRRIVFHGYIFPERTEIPEKFLQLSQDDIVPVVLTGRFVKQHRSQNMAKNIARADFDPKQRRLIRIAKVRELTGLSRSYIYSLSAEGLFPRSVPLVPRGTARAWLYNEVMDWLEGRVAERDMED